MALPETRFHPLSVTVPPTAAQLNLEGSETVYFVDYTGPKGFVESVAAAVPKGKVVVLDHHKTAMENLITDGAELALLKGSFGPSGPAVPATATSPSASLDKFKALTPSNVELHIDMLRSGATLSRDHFNPTLTPSLTRIIKHIEDADLWNWKLDNSKEFSAGFAKLDLDFSTTTNPSIFQQLQSLDPDALIETGKKEIAEIRKLVDSAMAKAGVINLPSTPPKSCLAVRMDTLEDAEAFSKHRSQLGNELAVKSQEMGMAPIGVVAYVIEPLNEKKIKVSFRSLGKEDTTPISQKFGGGGHANASSCIVAIDEYNKWAAA